jgi:uncharacterized protein involved in outer membrane biogenesis
MRRIAIGLTVLAVLAAGAVLVVRRALDAEMTRRAVESRLSALLAQPVAIGAIRVAVFPVPAVIGSQIVVGAQREAPELALERIQVLPRIGSLVRGPLVIREVILEGLAARIVRDMSGRWSFPTFMPAPGGDAKSGIVIQRVRLSGGRVAVFEEDANGSSRQTSSIDGIQGEAAAEGGRLRVAPLRGRVATAEVTGNAVIDQREARIEFTIPEIKGTDLGAVLGLAATSPPDFVSLPKPAALSLAIRFDREKSRLAGTGSLKTLEAGAYVLRLHGVEAPIRTDGSTLTFEPATFTFYGGSHRGKFTIDLARTPARWILDSQVSGVDAGQFFAAVTGRAQRIDGMAAATAALHAGFGEPMPRSLEGRMVVTIVNGVVREFPLLAAINRALRLAEGDSRDTRFDRLSATLVFPGGMSRPDASGSGSVTTNDAVLLARDVRVEAAGRIGFDRSLDLRGQAVLSPERSAEAIRSVRELSGLRNDRGEVELPLTISGTIDSPAIGIDVTAALGRSLKEELRRRLRRLIVR